MAVGSKVNISKSGVFTWDDGSGILPFTAAKANTFLIRSSRGMGINSSEVDGVNVAIGGAAHINGDVKLLGTPCRNNANLLAVFEVNNGCYYYCDGEYWQALNVGFTGADIAGVCNQ